MATFGTFGTLPPVPHFLQGAWSRRYIQRATEDGSWGPRSTAPVRYIQTPYAFVDVRVWKEEGVPWKDPGRVMAFAGITTTANTLPPGAGSWTAGGGAPRVSWHACHNWSPAADVEACWAAALSGAPVPTGDVGDFLPVDGWARAHVDTKTAMAWVPARPKHGTYMPEAGRSSGQPGARSGAESGLRSASWPRSEPP